MSSRVTSRHVAIPTPVLPVSNTAAPHRCVVFRCKQGYEGEGSLHQVLHGRGWVSALSSGSIVSATDFELFRLSLILTEEGERHTDEIIELCYRFIALLRAEPPQKRIQVKKIEVHLRYTLLSEMDHRGGELWELCLHTVYKTTEMLILCCVLSLVIVCSAYVRRTELVVEGVRVIVGCLDYATISVMVLFAPFGSGRFKMSACTHVLVAST